MGTAREELIFIDSSEDRSQAQTRPLESTLTINWNNEIITHSLNNYHNYYNDYHYSDYNDCNEYSKYRDNDLDLD